MPDPASIVLISLGGLILLGTCADAFYTMFSQRGAGWFTGLWTTGVWNLFLKIHKKRPIHRGLALVGPFLTVLTVVVWYALLLIGWTLTFLGGHGSVMVNSSGEGTDLLQRFYFVGTTLSGTGYGDLVPTRPPWTMLSNISAFTTSFLVASSISYIIPVISAALKRRQIGENIHSVGKDSEEILKLSWTDGGQVFSNSYWTELFRNLSHHSHLHLVYPVLHFYHAPDDRKASTLGILRLSDALFLIKQSSDTNARPPEIFFSIAHSAFQSFADVKGRHSSNNQDEETKVPNHLSPDTLHALGLKHVPLEKFTESLDEYRELRCKLVRLCKADGWSKEVAEMN